MSETIVIRGQRAVVAMAFIVRRTSNYFSGTTSTNNSISNTTMFTLPKTIYGTHYRKYRQVSANSLGTDSTAGKQFQIYHGASCADLTSEYDRIYAWSPRYEFKLFSVKRLSTIRKFVASQSKHFQQAPRGTTTLADHILSCKFGSSVLPASVYLHTAHTDTRCNLEHVQ